MKNESFLVDVVELSKQTCKAPIDAELKYATEKNFVGCIIPGYHPNAKNFALMTREAAEALCQVQNYLIKEHGCGVLIYDAYRPKRAVNYFVAWSKQAPENDYELQRKEKHYPRVDKEKLFELGYIAEDSGHCYGNTVDIFLCDINTGKRLNMGARFDLMDPLSWITATPEQIGEIPYHNRQILSEAMQQFGFLPYSEEFWHFSHGGKEGRKVQEPIDEPIIPEMKGLGCTPLRVDPLAA